MRKIKICFFLFVFVLLSFSVASQALANNVSRIDINVRLMENGDARITQIWTGNFTDSTENYIVIGNLNGIGIEDLFVSDRNGPYSFVSDWDIGASRNEKKNKYGIVRRDDGAYELCWGIGDYGDRVYSVSYTLTDFVASYDDLDGSNFMYVNPGMSTFPTDVTFELSLASGDPISDANADIWALGFNGEVEFFDGSIVARTYSSLEDDEYFVIMFSLEKGIVSPSRVLDMSFEDVKEEAFEGSDYSDDDGLWIIGVFFAIVVLAVAALAVHAIAVKRERKKFSESVPYFREIPNGGNLPLTYYLAQKFGVGGEEGAVIGAVIMQMAESGNIICDTEKSTGFFGNEKESHAMRLVDEPEDERLSQLYKIMKKAAGDDGILQEKELQKYCEKNYKSLRSFIDDIKNDGENIFCSMFGFISGISSRINHLTEKGKKELAEVVGLKKYLEEFSLIDERGIGEIEIWKDYLVYATLFGIADKVMEQLKKVYPDNIPQIEEYNARVNMTGIYYMSMYRSMHTAEQHARSAGSGGRASFGGGGGFSGGGFGGGSR